MKWELDYQRFPCLKSLKSLKRAGPGGGLKSLKRAGSGGCVPVRGCGSPPGQIFSAGQPRRRSPARGRRHTSGNALAA